MDTQMSFTEALSQSGLEVIDFVILLIYIVMLVSLGVILSYNRESKTKSTTDYFLAGNTLTWWAVGASLIAANISDHGIMGVQIRNNTNQSAKDHHKLQRDSSIE